MHPVLSDLLRLLELERIEDNIFRGESHDIGSTRVFGGQVLGQALTAAGYTVEGRSVHSLHAYFLRPGDCSAHIVYQVERDRDGRSFSNRRVIAIQHGRPIFNMTASFQVREEGLEHQTDMPEVRGPEGLRDVSELAAELADAVPESMRRFLLTRRPFEIRPLEPLAAGLSAPQPARRHFWIRTRDALSDEPALHENLLAYVSDYQLVSTATLPHELRFKLGSLQLASLDHAMWFHRPFRIDDWLLYAMESPNASGARGLALGKVYARDGRLVASTAQEGLMRVWPSES